MKNWMLIIILLFLGVACQDESVDYCGGDDPVNTLPWLNELTNSDQVDQFAWIQRFRFRGKYYFLMGSCCPNCSWMPIYFDCKGNRVSFDDDREIEVWEFTRVFREIVWQGGECVFIQ